MAKFNNLPKEIMLEILTRLPTESVLESKSVCKPWRDIVRHPLFSQLHLNHLHSEADDSDKLGFIFHRLEPVEPQEISTDDSGKSYITVLRCNHEFYYSEYDDDTPFDRKTRMNLNLPFKKYSFAGSCNGLICFNSWHNNDTDYGPVYICNPVTREYIILPNIEGEYWLNGFGYSSQTNEYKVVRIHRPKQDKDVKVVQVYTLGGGNGWRNVANIDININNFSRFPGAFANGAIHWASDRARTILAFHLADEKCTELPYPPCLKVAGYQYLGVLGDFLSMVTCYRAVEIWLLKKNKDNNDLLWTKEFSFGSLIPLPFGFTNSGRLLSYKDSRIFGYDLEESSSKMDVSFGKSITKAIPHTNTLVSLKVLGEKDAKTMESSGSASEAVESFALEASIRRK